MSLAGYLEPSCRNRAFLGADNPSFTAAELIRLTCEAYGQCRSQLAPAPGAVLSAGIRRHVRPLLRDLHGRQESTFADPRVATRQLTDGTPAYVDHVSVKGNWRRCAAAVCVCAFGHAHLITLMASRTVYTPNICPDAQRISLIFRGMHRHRDIAARFRIGAGPPEGSRIHVPTPRVPKASRRKSPDQPERNGGIVLDTDDAITRAAISADSCPQPGFRRHTSATRPYSIQADRCRCDFCHSAGRSLGRRYRIRHIIFKADLIDLTPRLSRRAYPNRDEGTALPI
jgi:hypothetical protein